MNEHRTPFVVHCGECKHEWTAFYSPIPLDKAGQIALSQHCPMCVADGTRIFCGPAPKEKKDD